MNFVILKQVDNEWWYWGTYACTDIEKIVSTAFYLGKCGYVSDIRVVPEQDYLDKNYE